MNFRYAAIYFDCQRNELAFRICQYFRDTICLSRLQNPPKALKPLEIINKAGGYVVELTPSPTHPNHYMAFLEMIHKNNITHFAKTNETLTSRGELGSCKVCHTTEFSFPEQKKLGT